jgi:hypothetical protein
MAPHSVASARKLADDMPMNDKREILRRGLAEQAPLLIAYSAG